MRFAPWLLGWALVLSPTRAPAQADLSFDGLASVFAARWEVYPLRGVTVFASDPKLVHPLALEELERFVDRTLDALRVPPDARQQLYAHPISYYFCADVYEVRFLSGTSHRGVALLEDRAIVSQWLPHNHEIVHVLAQIAVGGDQFAFEPMLSEGLAGALGGRGGLSPAILLAEADRILDDVDGQTFALWGAARFHGSGQDLATAYAVSARFVYFLLEEFGLDRFLSLYRLLAGSAEELRERPPQAAMTQLSGVYGMSWADLVQRFDRWRRLHPTPSLTEVEAPRRVPDAIATDAERWARAWWQPDGTAVLQIRAERGDPGGILQWGDPLPAEFQSRLHQGAPDSIVRRFGLRLEPGKAILYDYAFDIALLQARWSRASRWNDAPRRSLTVQIPARYRELVTSPTQLWLQATPLFEP